MAIARAMLDGKEESRLTQRGDAPRRMTKTETKDAAADISPTTAPSRATKATLRLSGEAR
jgi:hypothetical protein